MQGADSQGLDGALKVRTCYARDIRPASELRGAAGGSSWQRSLSQQGSPVCGCEPRLLLPQRRLRGL